jgi:hypothetical protein
LNERVISSAHVRFSRLFVLWVVAVCLVAFQSAAAPPIASTPPAPSEDVDVSLSAKLREQGNEAMLAMRYSDALSLYERALALNPSQVGLHYSLARAHQVLGEYPQALSELERFVRDASPDDKARVGRVDDLFGQIRPRVSTLDLRCNVKGARVLVRDRIVGTTPLSSLRLSAGATTLQIELEGFFPETRDIVLPGGGALVLDVVLHPKSTSGLLSVRTTPMGADIWVDGTIAGTTNPKIELALTAGSHDISARKSGYSDAKIPLVLQAGGARDLSIPLEKSVPITARWWFWTGLSVIAVSAGATVFALTTERSAGHGTLTPGQVSAP